MSVLLAIVMLSAPTPGSPVWVRAEGDAAGGGFVVDLQRRWVVTCRHVVGDQKTADVFFPWVRAGALVTDRRAYLGNRPRLRELGLLVTGRVVKTSDAADLALLELGALPSGVQAVRFAARPAAPGEPLAVVGHRSDLDTLWNVTAGPVRATGRLADGYDWRGRRLAVNAAVVVGQLPIEEGDSGGPVVNARGELVGMACALRRQAPLAAVAVSADEIRRFLSVDGPTANAEPHLIAESLTRATVWIRPTATETHLAGVLVERDLILTSARGLGPAGRVGVAFPVRDGGRWVNDRATYRDPVGLHLRGAWRAGEVVARDTDRDLALIRIDPAPEHAKPVTLAAARPKPGDAVRAMNHPAGLEFAWVYSAGVVRQTGPVKLADGDAARPVAASVLQLPTQAGSPGGPVFNDRGELVGVLSAREGAQHVGYAALPDEVRGFVAVAPPPDPWPVPVTRHALDRTVQLVQALQAVEAKTWRAARGELERVLDPYPADAEARQLLVRVLLGLNKEDEAAAAVGDTLRTDPARLPAVARDLLEQADALAKKYPDAPSAAADWLREALTAMRRAPLGAARLAELDGALTRAAAAKTDAERLTTLRECVIRLSRGV